MNFVVVSGGRTNGHNRFRSRCVQRAWDLHDHRGLRRSDCDFRRSSALRVGCSRNIVPPFQRFLPANQPLALIGGPIQS